MNRDSQTDKKTLPKPRNYLKKFLYVLETTTVCSYKMSVQFYFQGIGH